MKDKTEYIDIADGEVTTLNLNYALSEDIYLQIRVKVVHHEVYLGEILRYGVELLEGSRYVEDFWGTSRRAYNKGEVLYVYKDSLG